MITSENPKIKAQSRYTLSQAAKVMGVHRNTVARWIETGLISSERGQRSRRRFIMGSELRKLWRNR